MWVPSNPAGDRLDWVRVRLWGGYYVVRSDGQTDQSTDYARVVRCSPPKGGFSGEYGTARSRAPFWRIALTHAAVARKRGQRCYFLTHTMPMQVGNELRRAKWRALIDRLRKEPEVAGYVWVTELHTQQCEGLVHHHCLIRCRGYWDYRKVVQRWSKRYSLSSNGLDIQPVRTGRVGGYMGKALGYLSKGSNEEKLPFRWWGTSSVARQVRIRSEGVTLGMRPGEFGEPRRYGQRAYISRLIASDAVAAVTAALEDRRALRGRRRGLRAVGLRDFVVSVRHGPAQTSV